MLLFQYLKKHVVLIFLVKLFFIVRVIFRPVKSSSHIRLILYNLNFCLVENSLTTLKFIFNIKNFNLTHNAAFAMTLEITVSETHWL